MSQIFEAEQANLCVEPLKAAEVLCKSLESSLRLMFESLDQAVVAILSELVTSVGLVTLEVLLKAIDSNKDVEIISFIGGMTYQKDVFQFCYVYLRLVNSLFGILCSCEFAGMDSRIISLKSIVRNRFGITGGDDSSEKMLDAFIHPCISNVVNDLFAKIKSS